MSRAEIPKQPDTNGEYFQEIDPITPRKPFDPEDIFPLKDPKPLAPNQKPETVTRQNGKDRHNTIN